MCSRVVDANEQTQQTVDEDLGRGHDKPTHQVFPNCEITVHELVQ